MSFRLRHLGLTAASALTIAFGAAGFAPSAQACPNEPIIGGICLVAYPTCPTGWFPAQGQSLSISQYPELYKVIGTIYGGDGRTSFTLPDLRGRMPINQGQGPNLPNYPIGYKAGEPFTTPSLSTMPAHTHSLSGVEFTAEVVPVGTSDTATDTNGAGGLLGTRTDPVYKQPPATLGTTAISINSVSGQANGSTNAAGAAAQVENRSPYLALQYCIAVQGTPPSEVADKIKQRQSREAN